MVRLYNWNLLAPVFKPFGIVMDKTTKTLVVAGDLDAVANVLEKFYERTVGELPPIMPKVVHALKPKRSNTPDVFNGVIDNGGSMLSDPAPITSRITASMKNARLQRPALVDPAGRSLIDMNDDPMWTNSPTKMPGEKGPPEKPLRGADEEDAARGPGAEPGVVLGPFKDINNLLKLLLRLVDAGDVVERRARRGQSAALLTARHPPRAGVGTPAHAPHHAATSLAHPPAVLAHPVEQIGRAHV